MAKYDPLFQFLCRCADEPIELSFADIEGLVGPLPASAARSAAWWSNEPSGGSQVQANAWLRAGREVVKVDRDRQLVRFSSAHWRRGS